MEKMLKLLRGKKTYIIGVVIALLGVLEGTGVFTIPEYVWPILIAAGLGTMRSGISDISKQVKK